MVVLKQFVDQGTIVEVRTLLHQIPANCFCGHSHLTPLSATLFASCSLTIIFTISLVVVLCRNKFASRADDSSGKIIATNQTTTVL